MGNRAIGNRVHVYLASDGTRIRDGRSPERSPDDWREAYGQGVDVHDGIPTVYRGVYLFVNGYPELKAILASSPAVY